jgi:hypothetical protein
VGDSAFFFLLSERVGSRRQIGKGSDNNNNKNGAGSFAELE